MIKRFKGKFKFIILTFIVVVVALISINCVLSYWNNYRINSFRTSKSTIWETKQYFNAIESQLFHGVDMGVRAYRITKDRSSLDMYHNAIERKDSIFDQLYKNLSLLDIPEAGLVSVEDTVTKYIAFCTHLKQLVDDESYQAFDSLLLKDLGYYYWTNYNNYKKTLFTKLNTYNNRMDASTHNALAENFFVQIITIVIAVPLLILLCILVIKYEQILNSTLKEVQEKNLALEHYYDILSHQIRSPICSLQGLIHLMNRTDNSRDKKEILNRIKSINDNLDELTRLNRNGVEEEIHAESGLYQ